MYSLFWASKTLIMDFFSKRSLSCLSPFIQQSEYKRTGVIQTNTSELLVVPISDKEIQQPREVYDMFIWMSIPSTLSQPLHQSSENVSQKQNTEAISWMWLQIPFCHFWGGKKIEERKISRNAVLCFVLPIFSQKWRSFVASSVDWPRAGADDCNGNVSSQKQSSRLPSF